MTTFAEHKAWYYETHPNSVPQKPQQKRFRIWAASVIWGIVFFASAVVSAAHTIPAVRATIPLEIGEQFIIFSSFSAALSIELGIFAAALFKTTKRVSKLALWIAVISAMATNIYSSITALGGFSFSGVVMIGTMVGIAAPLIAYLSGENLSEVINHEGAQIIEAWQAYREEMKTLDAKILADWTKKQKTDQPTSSPSETKVGIREVRDYFNANPEVRDQWLDGLYTNKQMAEHLNTNPVTISNYKREIST